MQSYKKWIFLAVLFIAISACEKENSVPTTDPPQISSPEDKLVTVIMDEVGGVPVVLAGSKGANLIVAFESILNGTLLTFFPRGSELPVIMSDNEGNRWDIFGRCIFGPRKGAQLKNLNAGMGYWFIFGAMYPGVEIYEGEQRLVEYQGRETPGWAIPTNTIFQATGLDAIISLQNPAFEEYTLKQTEEFYLKDTDLVIGLSVNGEIKAYPHIVLDWHEIINDDIGGVPLAVTYCPLTGTGKIWDRKLSDGSSTTFGVSGFLYNSNIMPFDRATNSIWTQLDNKCVNGELINEEVEVYPFVETTWATWKTLFPRPVILTEDTGGGRNYQEYPYGDYRTNHDFLAFPVSVDDDRLPRKERVYGIIADGKAKVYRMDTF